MRLPTLTLFLTIALGLLWASGQQTAPSGQGTGLRFGVISYDDPEKKVRDYQALFSELNQEILQEAGMSGKIRCAVGTYADVLDWISRGLVDLAVLSPSAFAETKAGGNESKKAPDCIYIATEGKQPAENDNWVNSKLTEANLPKACRFEYNSICIVRADSKIRTFKDIRDNAETGIQFVFGDPLSASSTIFPMHVLRSHNIDFRRHMEYTFGQSDSVKRVLDYQFLEGDEATTRERVAFVFDLAVKDRQEVPAKGVEPPNRKEQFRRIEIELAESDRAKGKENTNDITLPMEVWVARKDLEQSKIDAIKRALRLHAARLKPQEKPQTGERDKVQQGGGPITDFQVHEDIPARFKALHMWAREIRAYLAEETGTGSKKLSDTTAEVPGMRFPIRFEDIVSLIRHYNGIYVTRQKTARLALVLSGGGAKCAYQAGAVEKIEETLLKSNSHLQAGEAPLDIELVVGTSGGALNAVPVAVGVSRQSAKDPPLALTWTDLNALKIIRAPWMVSICLGLCFTFFYFVMVRGGVRLIRNGTTRYKQEAAWMRLLGWLLIIIPAAVFLIFYFPALLNPLLRLDCHFLFYLLLVISWGVLVAVPLCIVWGILVLANAHNPRHQDRSHSKKLHQRLCIRLLAWSDPRHPIPFSHLTLLGVVLVAVALFFAIIHQGGLFRGDPLENVVIQEYARLFATPASGDLRRDGGKKIGEVILADDRRSRDLVITGSSLTKDSRGSKYFYLLGKSRRDPNLLPSYGSQGVEIGKACRIEHLVDIALGSGTIFPFFPSHEVAESRGVNPDGKDYSMKLMDLIDGGFAHNSPIEAAVRWGATHVILLGASPETEQEGKAKSPFFENIFTAIGYLYDQAQTADVSAQEEAAVFTLRPNLNDQPALGTLDFSPGFAKHALKRGRRDASGRAFIRQPARPLFWDTN